MGQPRVAFVVQRYGPDIAGGSEQLCRSVAERLSLHCSCDVITTCASDYVTWKNELPPGESICNRVRVLRFSIDEPRDLRVFNKLSARVLTQRTDVETQEQWMRAQGPYSTALLSFIERNQYTYDAFLFFTYLYCTTYFGLPLVRNRAILVPTAHDEPPVCLSIFDKVFRAPKRLLFLTPEEKDFVLKRFCLPPNVDDVGGFGLDPPLLHDRAPDPLSDARIGSAPYMLYLGRIDESKGCKILLEWFQQFAADYPDMDLNLVLAGKAVMAVPPERRVLSLGYVSEQAKARLIRNSLFMVAPSPYESLCISALESWLHGKPVLGNGKCLVLAGQCRRSRGGLWYSNYEEFAQCVSLLSSDADLRNQLGMAGRDYVMREFAWKSVEERYLRNISLVMGDGRVSTPAAMRWEA